MALLGAARHLLPALRVEVIERLTASVGRSSYGRGQGLDGPR